jgi:hypothetical protein
MVVGTTNGPETLRRGVKLEEATYPKGQTPVLQYSFTWKQLSAVARISFWSIYFQAGARRGAGA